MPNAKHARFDALVRRYTAFDGLVDLINSSPSYRPTLKPHIKADVPGVMALRRHLDRRFTIMGQDRRCYPEAISQEYLDNLPCN